MANGKNITMGKREDMVQKDRTRFDASVCAKKDSKPKAAIKGDTNPGYEKPPTKCPRRTLLKL
jgi:hypothetical protein